MSIPIALVIVVAAATAAALLMAVVRRLARGPLLAEPTRGTTMITIVGTAFAVLLAFITLDAFQTYSTAKRAAQEESVALLEMFRTADFFPPDERDEIRNDFVCYGRAVVADEWPAMREPRGHSERVDHWVDHFSEDFHRLVDVRSGRERLGFEEMLQETRARTAGRSERLAQAAPSVPARR